MLVQQIDQTVEVWAFEGAEASPGQPATLLFDIPHGATQRHDFTQLADSLHSPLPEGLIDFFFVNTDVGAFELARRTAELHVISRPTARVIIVRSRIPRTFIDCNRRLDAAPADFKAGGVTPGMMPWITDARDAALLRARYDAYHEVARAEVASLASDAAILPLHTYAPRSVGVEVDLDIVQNIRDAYTAEQQAQWPLRPEFDVICRGVDGTDYGPPEVLASLEAALAALGWPLGKSITYPLHPSTMAWNYVESHPLRTLCLEVRRDLLATPFSPFEEMTISPTHIEPIARALNTAMLAWWPTPHSPGAAHA